MICANPECSEPSAPWRGTGRKPIYCSPQCRRRAHYLFLERTPTRSPRRTVRDGRCDYTCGHDYLTMPLEPPPKRGT